MNRDISRRSFLKAGAFGAATTMVGCGPKSENEIDPAIYSDPAREELPVGEVVKKLPGGGPRPNVIIILTDDMGYGDLTCYGGKAIKTPRIDQMAAGGVKFNDFYCSSPLCSPSRAGLLTGRYPLRSGITFPLQPGKDTMQRKFIRSLGYFFGSLGILDLNGAKNMVSGLPLSEIAIPAALKLADYNTCAVGKWHLGDFVNDMDYHPHNYGFDYFCGFNASNDDWPAAFWRQKEEVVKDIALDQAQYTRLFTDEAIQFMQKSKDKPFFIYLAHKDPHQPCIPSDEFKDSSEGGRHGDTVQEVDYNVGRILDYLKQSGQEENTLVIFTSDNGPWFDGSPGGLRGRKGESYEGGYRVPMIASWPGVIPAGLEVDVPAMNFDFFTTILNLAGLDVPVDRVVDGKNIMGLMNGKESQSPHDALYFFHYREIEGVRIGDWKLLRSINTRTFPIPLDKKGTFFGDAAGGHDYHPEGSDESVPTMGSWPLLYNMRFDDGESYNVIKKYPAVADELMARLEQFEYEFFSNPRGWKR